MQKHLAGMSACDVCIVYSVSDDWSFKMYCDWRYNQKSFIRV